jgi:hypothetical protein
MSQFHSDDKHPQTCYFYLSSQDRKSAEIIQVYNCTSTSILIPVPEEDVELHSFFKRDMTDFEIEKFCEKSAWNIYTSWAQLEIDHLKSGISPDVLAMLLMHRSNKSLPKEHIKVI